MVKKITDIKTDAPRSKHAFYPREPLTYKKIEAVLGTERSELEAIIESSARSRIVGRGLQLISDRDKVQLATKPAFNAILESFVKKRYPRTLRLRR